MRKFNKWNKNSSGVVVMGILNVTPDSFSDGGSYNSVSDAVNRAFNMIEEGAGIIDIGGESTRPGFTPVSADEEIRRVIPVIKAIREKSDIVISVDTTKADVAKAALDAGADIINDISCLKDDDLARVVGESGCGYVLMHNRDTDQYDEFYTDYINDLKRALLKAEKYGISRDNIMIDPGVGFAKSYEQNLVVIKRLSELKEFGLPILLGVSRKSVVGLTLNLPSNQRVEGTLAIDAYGVLNGADILRVHDVKEHSRMVKMLEAIISVQ